MALLMKPKSQSFLWPGQNIGLRRNSRMHVLLPSNGMHMVFVPIGTSGRHGNSMGTKTDFDRPSDTALRSARIWGRLSVGELQRALDVRRWFQQGISQERP